MNRSKSETVETVKTRQPTVSTDHRADTAPTERGEQYAAEQTDLIAQDTVAALRADWDALKLKFVDEPASAVADAERLLYRTVDNLRDQLRADCDAISRDGPRHKKASTEQLRERFRRYEAMFERLGVHLIH